MIALAIISKAGRQAIDDFRVQRFACGIGAHLQGLMQVLRYAQCNAGVAIFVHGRHYTILVSKSLDTEMVSN